MSIVRIYSMLLDVIVFSVVFYSLKIIGVTNALY